MLECEIIFKNHVSVIPRFLFWIILRLVKTRVLGKTHNNGRIPTMDEDVENVSDQEQRLRCSSNLLKCLVVFINLIFLVCGLALIAFLIWIHINREGLIYSRLLEDPSSSSSSSSLPHHQQHQRIPYSVIHKTTIVVVITLVVLIIAFGFLGCCGVSVESVCFLCLCIILIVSVVITEIVVVSMFPSIKERMYSDLLLRMQHQIQTEYNRTTVATVADQQQQSSVADLQLLTVAWNTLQIKFSCCGASGPRDFLFSAWYNQTKDSEGMFVPRTCCVLTEPNPEHPVARNEPFCQIEALLGDINDQQIVELQQSGCHEMFTSYLDTYIQHPLVTGVSVVVILLQVLDVIFCCILAFRIRKRLSEIDLSDNEDSEGEESDED